jgi:high-affinity iron transporter
MSWRAWLIAFGLLSTPVAVGAEDGAQTLLHLLDYIAVDYGGAVGEGGKVQDSGEYREMREFAAQVRAAIERLPANPAKTEIARTAARLETRIAQRAAAHEVAEDVLALRQRLIDAYGVQAVPRRAPDLARGASLYSSACAGCHGLDGRGDGPAARGLDPAPSDFHDTQRMAKRSLYGLYSTITFGVEGTAMQAYQALSEADRWALAFHVANLAAEPAQRNRGAALWAAGRGREAFPDLERLVMRSAEEVGAEHGEAALAVRTYLIAHPEVLSPAGDDEIDRAAAALEKSLVAYRAGRRHEAIQQAIEAYLDGFELAESKLKGVAAALTAEIEREMMAYRALLQAGAAIDTVQDKARRLHSLLAEARARLGAGREGASVLTTFAAAFVTLLREGIEAILVVAAILSFLARAGADQARRWVHAGWIAALLFGFATWGVSSELIEISGASRETTEGVTALVAAAMLLYVGYWLHSRSHSQAWQAFLTEKIGGALSRGTTLSLALISFLAVYRESFETVLFYQALAMQAGPSGRGALLGGVAVAALLLLAVAWAILRASVRLPLGLFFTLSGYLLLVLAVVFTGQGVAALQKAGQIGIDSVDFVTVPMLGIYPTLQTLGAQAAVIAAGGLALWWTLHKRDGARSVTRG